MIVYINGQDINKIFFSDLSREDGEFGIYEKQCGPEGFLKAFRDFLSDQGLVLDDVKQIFCVVGPGSATALRSSLAMVNTLAFTKGIKLVAVEKEKGEQDIDTVKRLVEHDLSKFEIKNVLMPKYEHKPRITLSTKDALRRRVG